MAMLSFLLKDKSKYQRAADFAWQTASNNRYQQAAQVEVLSIAYTVNPADDEYKVEGPITFSKAAVENKIMAMKYSFIKFEQPCPIMVSFLIQKRKNNATNFKPDFTCMEK